MLTFTLHIGERIGAVNLLSVYISFPHLCVSVSWFATASIVH